GSRARAAAGQLLAFRVLRSLAGPLQSVLLALLHPRVARQQSGLLQRRAEVRGVAQQGPRDAMRDGSRLSAGAATDDLDADVELSLCACDAKGRQRGHLEHAPAEISQRVSLIDRDAAFAQLQSHPRDRILPAPGASVQQLS